jgi:alkane 1-monooxygenase
MKDLKYPAAITIPLAAIISIYIKGIWVFFTPFYVFAMIPLLELLLTQNAKNYSEDELKKKGVNLLFNKKHEYNSYRSNGNTWFTSFI